MIRRFFRNLFGLWRIGVLARIGGETPESLVDLAQPPRPAKTKREKRPHKYYRIGEWAKPTIWS